MRTNLQRDADRRANRLRTTIASDLERFREDAGLTRAAVARAAGLHPSVVARVESGEIAPTLETYCRLSAALGADFSARPYPNTGPPVHDRHAVAMTDVLLRSRHHRWSAFPEVPVRTPARGVIDVVLHEARSRVLVASEFVSDLRRVEQTIRWSGEKADSLPSASAWGAWAEAGAPTISRLLLVRWTRANREAVAAARHQIRAAYPGDPDMALESLTMTDGAWPGAAMLWVRLEGDRPRLTAR